MENSRLNDMLARYGEVCTQKAAAQILNIVPRTVARMCDEGRLRRVGHRVDVRSIYEYIVNPRKESSLPLLPATLEQLEKKPMTPGELYKKMKKKVSSLYEFMEILDCLYALSKIEFEEGVLRYVD